MIKQDGPARQGAEELFRRYLEGEREGRTITLGDLLADAPTSVRAEFHALHEDYLILRRQLSTSAVDLVPGKRLGGFRILRRLGSGGMGIVFEAMQEGLGRSVALKVLHPHLLLSARAVERFRREAEAGGRLRHPALVQVYAIGDEQGVAFLAQELLESGSLADRIAALRGVDAELSDESFRDTARLFARLAGGLSSAHEAGILHRDVKPSNILFDHDGQAKLCDFGLATALDGSAASLTGDFACTLAYASPEQLRGDRRRVDARSDVYSLGATLYEALTLRRLFEGDAPQALIHTVLHVEPLDPRRLRSRIPRELALICLRALEKNPARRYASARELADDLGRFLRYEPVVARPAGAVGRVWKWCQRRPTVATLIGVASAYTITLSILLPVVVKQRNSARVLATGMAELVANQQEQGHLQLAEESYVKVIHWFTEVFGSGSEQVLIVRRGLAILYLRERRIQEASDLIDELIPLFEDVLGSEDPETILALRTKTEVLHAQGHLIEALGLIREQLRRLDASGGKKEERRIILHYLAINAAGSGNGESYVAARREQIDNYLASDKKGRAAAQVALATALIFNHEQEKAAALIAAAEEVLGVDRNVLNARAQLAAARHDWSAAWDYYGRAERLLYPADDPLGELRAILTLQKALLAVSEKDDEASQLALDQARKALPPQLVEWRFREPAP